VGGASRVCVDAKMSETVLPFMFKPELDKDGETKKYSSDF